MNKFTRKPTRYFSVDIEATGLTPGKYSMIALGACVVGNMSIQFYREIKPLNDNYILPAIKIGASELRCLKEYKHLPEFNPRSRRYDPLKVLEVLRKKGEKPEKVMSDFAEWVIKNSKGFRPFEVADPIKFDGMFTAWYFDNFYPGKNPLGYSGENINSMFRGLLRDTNADISSLGFEGMHLRPHHALQDAIVQAYEFEEVLKMMRTKK